MQISPSGTVHNQQVYSDANEYRNEDLIVVNGLAYFKGGTLNAVAAEFAHMQIINPNGSGVTVLLDKLYFSTGTTQKMTLATYGTQLTDPVGPWANKLVGGAVGNALARQQTNASILGVAQMHFTVTGSIPVFMPFSPAIILLEDEGILIACRTVNTTLQVGFFGREV